MADSMTPQQRSKCMAAVKGRDTRPEMAVRRYLYSQGLRYRVNDRRLPGAPDIVLSRYRTVIFVDGCFWHGHEGCAHSRIPDSNSDYWRHKITLNRARDYRVDVELRRMGWRVIRIWECAIDETALQVLYQRVVGTPGVGDGSDTTEDAVGSSLAAEAPEAYGLPY